ncbi:uncharacterized protein TNCV_2254671 [Trichonephila clavipes]|nr:uncharacterized protein TNCV_2254671 [Trichonephila clavipes]
MLSRNDKPSVSEAVSELNTWWKLKYRLDVFRAINEPDFAASKTTDHDVVGDEPENNSANPQTPVVESQQINHPEKPKLMANADYDALTKPVKRREAREAKKGVKNLKISSCMPKYRPNSQVASTAKDGVIRCPTCEKQYCDPRTEEWVQCCKCQEWWHEECSNYENGIFICDYC